MTKFDGLSRVGVLWFGKSLLYYFDAGIANEHPMNDVRFQKVWMMMAESFLQKELGLSLSH